MWLLVSGDFFWKTQCESRALIYLTLNIDLATMRLDNPRPVPMPTGLVVKNGSNILLPIPSGMPVPASLT